jgi:iron only hydrogenase large subunit-like protein
MNYLVDTNVFLEILLSQAGRKKCEAFLQGEKGAAWISDFTLHSACCPQFIILSLSDAGYLQLAGANAPAQPRLR